MKKSYSDFLPIKTTKKTKVGIFIDEANLFYIQRELGWKIDWTKLAQLFSQNFHLKILRYYLGMPVAGPGRLKNLKIQKILELAGYTVVTKPLKKILIDSHSKKYRYKCNFDVEIGLDVSTFIKNLDLIIIVSGDSDFIAIKDYVLINNKQFLFVCFEKRVAWEIRRSKHLFLEQIKDKIEYKKKKPRQKVEVK